MNIILISIALLFILFLLLTGILITIRVFIDELPMMKEMMNELLHGYKKKN